jgi:hypothetical protein
MLRDPAIHIKKSDLLRICKEEGITFPEDFVVNVMMKAAKVKLTNRVIIAPKAATKAKAARTVATKDTVVANFNRIYTATLVNHDRRPKQIMKGTAQYLTMKEVATAAYDFMQDYKLTSIDEAFKTYVGIGIILIGINKFSITRLKGADQKIRDRYENMEILKWVDPISTQLMRSAWDRSLKNFHNMSMELNIDQMGSIARAAKDAQEAQADPKDWMDAQFDKWTFLNSMPEFSQIHGDNAKLAYVKYMAKKGQIPIKGQKRQRGED